MHLSLPLWTTTDLMIRQYETAKIDVQRNKMIIKSAIAHYQVETLLLDKESTRPHGVGVVFWNLKRLIIMRRQDQYVVFKAPVSRN
jgi:hypothetical protein